MKKPLIETLFCGRKLAAVCLFTMALGIPGAISARADDGRQSIAEVYEAGRQAYFRNDFAAAKPCFRKVLRAKPGHVPSLAMLNTILEAEKKAAAQMSMLGWAKRTLIPSIDVEDAPIEEVIAFLRVKSRTLTNGAWEPNFILRKPAEGRTPGVTISLREVPVEYVVQKLGEACGLAVRYEEHAIIIAPAELLPPEPDVPREARAAATRQEP